MSEELNKSLLNLNSFGFAATAKKFCHAKSSHEAIAFIKKAETRNVIILGGGSNLLFTKSEYDYVLQYQNNLIEIISENESAVTLRAGASVPWTDLVDHTVSLGLGGLENLSLIPGWVGAAPMQNIGAYGVEVKDVITNVDAIDIKTGHVKSFSNSECGFGYRESVFKHELKGRYLIDSVTFCLDKHPKLKLNYGAIKSELELFNISRPTIKDVSEAVKRIRRSKLPDPAVIGNAGSFFKNPEIDSALAEAIKITYTDMPMYPGQQGLVKIPAGYLIEKAGWKGYRTANVGIHPMQALVLVHYGGGSGQEILDLSAAIQADILSKFDISLSIEVNII